MLLEETKVYKIRYEYFHLPSATRKAQSINYS